MLGIDSAFDTSQGMEKKILALVLRKRIFTKFRRNQKKKGFSQLIQRTKKIFVSFARKRAEIEFNCRNLIVVAVLHYWNSLSFSDSFPSLEQTTH